MNENKNKQGLTSIDTNTLNDAVTDYENAFGFNSNSNGTIACDSSYNSITIRGSEFNGIQWSNPSEPFYMYKTRIIMQKKVAVFKLTRNDDGEIISSEFIVERWVEVKNNASLEVIASRFEECKDIDPENLFIKETSLIKIQ